LLSEKQIIGYVKYSTFDKEQGKSKKKTN